MKLIVGLGNKGQKYNNTRHNVGFMAIDELAQYYNVGFDKTKFNGSYNTLHLNDEKIILLKPMSYMNLSGGVVKKFIDFFQIDLDNVLIISDDLDIPVGQIKMKYQGGSGGHNGLKDIENHLGTKKYKRLKIGISNNKDIATEHYVLGKFSKEEQQSIVEVIEKSPQIIEDFLNLSFENLMNKYNTK